MARYGRDFDRSPFGPDRGFRGQGGEYGGMSSDGSGNGYGGMGADAGGRGGSQGREGYTGFGTGGGAYDQDFNSGFRGGQGRGGGYGQQGGGYGGMGGGYGQQGGFGGGQGRGMGGMGGGMQGRGGGSQAYGGGRGYGNEGGGYGALGGPRDYGSQQRGGMGGGDDLRRMRAAEIMTENPEVVTPEASLADAARKMRDLNVGIIPVVESEQNRRLRGVITDRDIAIRAVAEGMDASSTRVQDVMSTGVETCNKNDSVQDVLALMEREQVRRVPITDREGRLVGIVAQADVATDLDSEAGSRRVADTLERISEPGQPRGGMRASQSRGMSQSGGAQAGGTITGGFNRTDAGESTGGLSADSDNT